MRREVRKREKNKEEMRERGYTRPLLPAKMLLVPISFASEICLPGSD